MMAPGEPESARGGGGGGGRHFLDVSPRLRPPPPLPGALPAYGLARPAQRPSAFAPRSMHAGRSGARDAGAPLWALLALVAATVLVPAIVYVQQSALAKIESDWRAEEAQAGPDGPITPPGFDQFTLATKAFMKMNEAIRADRPAGGGPWAQDRLMLSSLDSYAITLPEQVRLAVAKGELAGADAALKQLDRATRLVDPDGELARDIAALRTVYRDGVDAVDEESRAGLIERHGWYGKVALTFGTRKSSDARQALLGGGWRFLWSMLLIMMALGVGFVGSLVLLLLAIITILTGRLRLRLTMPSPGGSVYLETFVVFMAAFVGLLAFSWWLETREVERQTAEWALLLGPWAIAPAVLWPLVRGVSWRRYRAEIGWHAGEGFWREVGCGIAGYLASVPLYLVVVLGMLIIEVVRLTVSGEIDETPPPGEFPIDLSGEDRWLMLAGLMALIAVWAPVVEETVFRGALMRHLTSRLHWLAAAAVTAIIFGAIHPYPIMGIVPVAFLGFVFGVMRRWRGSLIAPVTAHALHNGTIGVILVVILMLVAE